MEQAAPTPGTKSSSRGGAAPEEVRVRPTQQGTVYLWTLGVFSMFLLGFKANLAFLLGAFALGCAGVAWALTRRGLAQLRVDRESPRRTRVGVPTPMAWVVHNDGRRTRIGIELEDRPSRGAKPVRILAEVPVVAGGGSERCEGEVVFARRGEVDLGRQPLLIGTRYPLGLFRVSGRVRAPGRILVRPVEGRITPRLRSHVRGRRPIEARQRLAQGDDVIYGVREYREGDDPRRIHWRTTARRGTLAVSEWRTEEGREAVVVLGRGTGAGTTSVAHFERAVAAAATIWRACIRERLHVTLEFGDGSPVRS
ncbi:MAG: DUF58 domain-containing protein, partial [Planctomycetota bacterium]|nr:DUF58 domain-containing protein [Planctomycetota bacterium]